MACAGSSELSTAAEHASTLSANFENGQDLIVSVTSSDTQFCPSIKGTVTVEGATLTEWSTGQWLELQPPGSALPCPQAVCIAQCAPPYWIFKPSADAAAAESTSVRIVDGPEHWELSVAHLFAQRTVTPSDASPLVFFASPPTDELQSWIIPVATADGGSLTVGVTYDAGTLTLLAPAGGGPYQVGPLPMNARVLSCDGPAACSAALVYAFPASASEP